MSLLNVSGLTKYYGAEHIFSDVSFQVARGEKLALVGVNGAGKTTLLKIVAGSERPSAGGANLARGTRMAYLSQEVRFAGGLTLWDEMERAFDYLNGLQQEITALEQALADTNAPDWEQRMERYGTLTERFEHGGGYGIEQRIRRTLHGLGFVEGQYQQQLTQFSGGQKTRAALAYALLSGPDLLLLDEPTNHLDLEALEWLEGFLRSWEGTLIVISHDRYFLDRVTTRTIEMAFGTIEDYAAGYNHYLELKAERMERRLKEWQSQRDYIAKTEDFIRRFKAGQRSKEAKGREKRLTRLKTGWEGTSGKAEKLIERPKDPGKLKLFIDSKLRSGEMVLKLDGLQVGFKASGGNKQLLKTPDLEIHRGECVALMGPNGAGKTTLLRTLVGELPALGGRALLGHQVHIGYYAQGHDGLRMEATVLEEIQRVDATMGETETRTLLGRFQFSGDDVFKRVGDLSGGERSRVALAQLTLTPGNLLVMDEPTNHLDIGAREALETVLREYRGSILFVSHDRYFIDAVADTIWMVGDGTISSFAGNFSEYVAARAAADA
ncbi:MAG: ABC-F family ATP-binding cassette domain-containing protein, partial [Chloroflexales bacterium]|nr:ABC-F family ATP-binding cassette domain-containing protein [Chloroflexales bacterium]